MADSGSPLSFASSFGGGNSAALLRGLSAIAAASQREAIPLGSGYVMRKRKGFGDILGSGASATLAEWPTICSGSRKRDALSCSGRSWRRETDARWNGWRRSVRALKQDIAKAEAMGEVSLAQELRRIDELGRRRFNWPSTSGWRGEGGNQVDSARLALMLRCRSGSGRSRRRTIWGTVAVGAGTGEPGERAAAETAGECWLRCRSVFRQESARNQLGSGWTRRRRSGRWNGNGRTRI
jgi:hypothetical protein